MFTKIIILAQFGLICNKFTWVILSPVEFKVSSNPKNWDINKWRFFIKSSNIHPQISLILLNVVPFLNICNFFADKCLKMKLLIDICLYYAESKKMHRFAYILGRSKHRTLCRVDLPWGRLGRFLILTFLKWSFLKMLLHFESERRLIVFSL